MAERDRYGPLAVQRPFYPEGEVCHVYLLHPPGGVVGGDTLSIDVDAANGASALVTTPAAAKFYRSAGPTAHQSQRLVLAPEATLEWLPQENIYFQGARVKLDTHIELHGESQLLMWDIHCFGRPVIDEVFAHGEFENRLSIYRDRHPLLVERQLFHPANRRHRSLMAGRAVTALMVATNANHTLAQQCRDQASADYAIGVTLIADLLVVRYLGDSTETARRVLTSMWACVRKVTMGRRLSVPRIWFT
ncbi:MAG: urease accessory protein UreD [Gammaproteobacteria bacterium]